MFSILDKNFPNSEREFSKLMNIGNTNSNDFFLYHNFGTGPNAKPFGLVTKSLEYMTIAPLFWPSFHCCLHNSFIADII